jgi:hypothetical protein
MCQFENMQVCQSVASGHPQVSSSYFEAACGYPHIICGQLDGLKRCFDETSSQLDGIKNHFDIASRRFA